MCWKTFFLANGAQLVLCMLPSEHAICIGMYILGLDACVLGNIAC